MKISASASGIEASGAVGRQEGSVGIDSEGIIELGIDFKVGGLGITTDYGGAIVVSIAGQSITWGREGGLIEYKFAGFEVTVEARDCVVTETKKIAGMIVAQHTYPDPGCKLPEPEPEPESTIPVPTPINPNNLPTENKCGNGKWLLLGVGYFFSTNSIRVYKIEECISLMIEDRNSQYNESFDHTHANDGFGIGNWQQVRRPMRFNENQGILCGWRFFSNEEPFESGKVVDSWYVYPSGVVSSDYSSDFYIPKNAIYEKPETWAYGYVFTGDAYDWKFTLLSALPPPVCRIPLKPKQAPPLAGNKPPMPESCCESLKADIEDIKQVLAVKEMLAKKVQIPVELLEIQTDGMPAPKPEIILNYAQMGNATLMAIDRYGINAPIQVQIKDTDTTKKGDQSDEFTYNSPAVAMQAMLELLWEIKGDSASRLKIQVRMAYAVTRTLKIVAGVGESVRTLIKMLGLPFRPGRKKLPLEFNLGAAKKGSGFGKSQGRKGTSETEAELESLLPGLLEETEYDLPVPEFDAKDEDIRELLVKILIAVQTKQGK